MSTATAAETEAKGSRKETDSLGAVEAPADKLWGAQTQRSLRHFSIGALGEIEALHSSVVIAGDGVLDPDSLARYIDNPGSLWVTAKAVMGSATASA
jgi:hypothetical protein